MALIIKDLLNTDTFETIIKKTNFNFDQIQANGGGPVGGIGDKGGPGNTGSPGINGTYWHVVTNITTFLADTSVKENNDLVLLTEPFTYLGIPYIKGDIFRINIVSSTITLTHIGNIKPDITVTPTGTSGIFESIYDGINNMYHRNSTEMDRIPLMFATEDTTATSPVLNKLRENLLAGANKSAAYIYGNDSTIGGGRLSFLYGIGTGSFPLSEITNAPYIQGTINSDKLSLLISSNHNIRAKFNENFFISDNAGTDIFSIIKTTAGPSTTNTTNIHFTNSTDNFNIGSDTSSNIYTFSATKSEFDAPTEWNNTDYIRITSGSTAERPITGVKGMVRFNSTKNAYEGYINTWVPLQGVYDSDSDTYIDVDIATDTDIMKFYTAGTLALQIKADQRSNFLNHVEMKGYKGIVFANKFWSGIGPVPAIPEAERTFDDYRYEHNRAGMNARGAGGLGGNFYHSGVVVTPTIVNNSGNSYNKSGMGVTFNLNLEFTILANMSYSSGTTDAPLTVVALPFPCAGPSIYMFPVATENINIASDVIQVIGYVDPNVSASTIRLKGVRSNGTFRDIMCSDVTRNGSTVNRIMINGCYTTTTRNYDDPFAVGSSTGGGGGAGTPGGGTPVPSDFRLKKDVVKLDNVTERLIQMNGYSYLYRSDEYPDLNLSTAQELGVMAQEVEKVFPQAIVQNEQGFKMVKYNSLIPALIEGFKEQQERINKLEELINKK